MSRDEVAAAPDDLGHCLDRTVDHDPEVQRTQAHQAGNVCDTGHLAGRADQVLLATAPDVRSRWRAGLGYGELRKLVDEELAIAGSRKAG